MVGRTITPSLSWGTGLNLQASSQRQVIFSESVSHSQTHCRKITAKNAITPITEINPARTVAKELGTSG